MLVIIKALVLPPAINLIVALIGFIILIYKRRLGITLIFLAVFSLYMLSTAPVSTLLLSGLEIYPPIPEQIVSQGEKAIVVLGGGRYSKAPEYFSDTVSAPTLERLRYAILLKKKTGLPILVTGGGLEDNVISQAELMSNVSKEYFHEDVTWIETTSRNTAENAKYSVEILQKADIDKIYLVTHAFHMLRAVWIFEKVGLQVTPAPTVFDIHDVDISTFSGFIPTISNLNWSTIALHEYFGLLWYQIRY